MNRKRRNFVLSVAVASGMLLRSALADSLVTTDNELLSGHVKKTDAGYTIETTSGPVDVPADKVKKILYDHLQSIPAKPATPDTKPDPKSTPAHTPGAKDAKAINALLAQGNAAMTAGEFSDARDAFADALALDSNNAIAGRGLGFAYIKLGKLTSAAKPLEMAAVSQPIDRSLTLALSASLVATHNPARAVKFLNAYLEAHATPLDEPMVNALGIALSQVDRSATLTPLFSDAVALYIKLDDELDATQTDKKRWGIEWLPIADAQAKQKSHAVAQKASDAAAAKLQSANSAVASAQTALSSAQNGQAYNAKKQQKVQAAQDQLDTATTKQKESQDAYDVTAKALADAPGPDFPKDISLAGVDLSMNPAAPVVVLATPVPNHKPAPTPITPADNTDPIPTPVTKVEKPQHSTRYAVAFAIAPDVLVTAASAVEDATDIQLTTSDGKNLTATVLQAHHADGIALLKVDGGKLPCLPLADSAPAGATLNCLGYPEVDLFNPLAKSMTVTANDQAPDWTVRFEQSPRLPGGPIMAGNTVVGVELGERDSDPTAVPAATLKSLLKLVQDNAHPGEPAKDPKKAVVQVMAER